MITESDSEWIGCQAGLTLKDPVPRAPIPCAGALGYFEWARGGKLAPPTKWMTNWGTPGAGTANDLFTEAPIAFERPPKKPWGQPVSVRFPFAAFCCRRAISESMAPGPQRPQKKIQGSGGIRPLCKWRNAPI
ncbi:MAG: hypothetical protein ABJ360_02090 [Roseobacter sp.]